MAIQSSTDLAHLSQSAQAAAKTLYAAFSALKDADGVLSRKDLMKAMENSLTFSDWENNIYESNGSKRWQTIFLFYSINALKSGYIRKEKGTWYLTQEGIDAMKEGPVQLLRKCEDGYRNWVAINKQENGDPMNPTADVDDGGELVQKVNLELLQDQALDGIHAFISRKNAYEFQDMVAALLSSMGYYVSFVAPKGKDGGIDIIAYQDALGIKTPRIKVQVKHYNQSTIGPDPIRSLKGLINGVEEIGLFVTNSSFTKDSERFARESNTHIRLIDGGEFIELWTEHYNQLTDEQKNMLPLQAIFFLGSNE